MVMVIMGAIFLASVGDILAIVSLFIFVAFGRLSVFGSTSHLIYGFSSRLSQTTPNIVTRANRLELVG